MSVHKEKTHEKVHFVQVKKPCLYSLALEPNQIDRKCEYHTLHTSLEGH